GGRRAEEEIDLLAPHVAHVHVKDKRGGRGVYDFPPLGDGEIDYRRIFSSLDAVGFDGPYMIEPELSLVEAERPPAEVEEALRDPGSAYQRHTYLGTSNADEVDADLAR